MVTMTAKPLLTGAFHNPPIVVAQTVTMLEEHETSGITRAAVLANYRHGVVQTETEAGLVPKGGIIHLLIVAMSAIALQSATNHLPTVGTMTGAIRVADTTTLGDVLVRGEIVMTPVATHARVLQAVHDTSSANLLSAIAHRGVYMTAVPSEMLLSDKTFTSKIAVPMATLTFHGKLAGHRPLQRSAKLRRRLVRRLFSTMVSMTSNQGDPMAMADSLSILPYGELLGVSIATTVTKAAWPQESWLHTLQLAQLCAQVNRPNQMSTCALQLRTQRQKGPTMS
ncbi:hypothetical protein HBH56_159760 [Parastagonospora nodorum]|uniref:Uncharacterized protein n=1 Tax=Phaeosphaeria nodorum (strain SN15 / ATCC MYA-4574 / FGSC 10173) TaxID=321614 RepID=A0A7U2F280_PHANO|nr:hypothetical protein HBH56_159760 [Parastagonospora nodorum]QRC97277.1 hypothetical protein JI435_089420 [Parastagonospora nodorum SN15]KAH3922411.1 hypothetical protein HBH54_224190 [Parastagonospora nodorum]KAH3969674.1 hypothetical protein HBH52_170180 [Parastagonospora nodorum]KAH3973482.1 hypothetical protein HBH51_095380 [Parastagonospora nodorum]